MFYIRIKNNSPISGTGKISLKNTSLTIIKVPGELEPNMKN